MGTSALYGRTALRPSVASPPHSCLKAFRCFAHLRSAATPPLPTIGGFAASQLRTKGSALRAFGSRSYYHETKVASRHPRRLRHLERTRAAMMTPGAPGCATFPWDSVERESESDRPNNVGD